MTEAGDYTLLSPTQDERTMAILAHVLQLVGWWIAPLVIFLLRRESRFVAFHALQAIFLQLVYMMFMICFVVVWLAFVFSTIATQGSGSNSAPPPGFFFVMPLLWLGFMGLWVLMLVLAIVYGVKAGRGEWAEYPLLGPLAKRVLNIGVGGA